MEVKKAPRSSRADAAIALALATALCALLALGAMAQDDALRFFDQAAHARLFADRPALAKQKLGTLNDALSLMNEAHRSARLKDHTLNGKIGFSSFTNVANGDARSNIQVTLGGDFYGGTYPTEHKIKGSVQLRNNDGVVFEDLSALHVALDHHPLHGFDSRWAERLEVFGFIDRNANSYMGVKRRYQGGGGIIIGHSSGEVDDPASRKANVYRESRSDKLNRVDFTKCDLGDEALSAVVMEELRRQQGLNGEKSANALNENRGKLLRMQRDAKRYLAKRYAKHQFSFLAELLLEDDLLEFSDSLSRLRLSSDTLVRPDTLLTTRFTNPAKPRIGFRFKYHWRTSGGLSLSASAWAFYWLNPEPWRAAQDAERLRLDRAPDEAWRIWLPVELSYSPDEFVSIGIEYGYTKEYSPLRRWVPFGNEGGYALLEVPDEFWNVVLTVNVKIK